MKLAKIELSGTVILPYKEGIALMAAAENAEILEGWSESSWKIIPEGRALTMTAFDADTLKDIKKAQLLGTPYDEYLQQIKEKKNAK